MRTTAPAGITVGRVAALAGVTVRTLHHYEQIGLLVPSDRSPAGYRIYTAADIDRLTRILYYRALALPLHELTPLLDDHRPLRHLERQHTLLKERLARNQRMLAAIERELEAHRMSYNLTPEEKLEVFGEFDPDAHEAEAQERWDDTEAWHESRRRASRYSADDWRRIQAGTADLNARLAATMQSGEPATGKVAMNLAEEHRQAISRNFYECSPQMHRALGDLYISDARFTATIDAAGEGLAAWLREAIIANAERRK